MDVVGTMVSVSALYIQRIYAGAMEGAARRFDCLYGALTSAIYRCVDATHFWVAVLALVGMQHILAVVLWKVAGSHLRLALHPFSLD